GLVGPSVDAGHAHTAQTRYIGAHIAPPSSLAFGFQWSPMIADASCQTPAGVVPQSAKPSVMTIHEASRTLLKSPPELWAECSDAASLGRHLDQLGEIKTPRLEPEPAVAWEGEHVSGTVRLEPSGWGTRVILTAEEVDLPDLSPPAQPDELTEAP